MKRIDCIANMIKPVDVMADIGTDHAYLPILLVQTGRVKRAYACDVTKGPLSIAQEHIAQENLSQQIEAVLSDGFQHVPNDAQCAVIAGMGCHTILSILEAAMDRLPAFSQIVVQSNNDVPLLRQWISAHHFTIQEEAVVEEKGHDYIVIAFDCAPHEAYKEEELLLGPCLIQNPTEEFRAYCQRQRDKLDFIFSKRPADQVDEELKKKREWFHSFC